MVRKLHPIALLVLVVTFAAHAKERSRDEQIAAAREDALARLRADVEDEKLAPELTVAQFVEKTQSQARLMQALRTADPVGGPRWLDEQTCQVTLWVSAEVVGDALKRIASDRGAQSPIPVDALSIKLKDWSGRTFIATGSSITASRVEVVRPTDEQSPWRQVPDDERRSAMTRAKENAVARVLERLKPVEISPGRTVGDAMSNDALRTRFTRWLQTRPVTAVRFADDLTVDLTLAAGESEVFEAFITAASGSVDMPTSESDLARLREEFESRASNLSGEATARVLGAPDAKRAQSYVPRKKPTWSRQQIETEATAEFEGSKLKTARRAEALALERLRSRVESLKLSDAVSIGDASNLDPEIEKALAHSLQRAKVVNVEYQPDGSVRVRLLLDARDLWDELQELPE